MNDKRVSRKRMRGMPQAQRGAAIIIFTIGMVAILGMAGLALDMGHAYLNKTRLQNALDAAALSGEKTLLSGSTTADAETAALNTFNQHRQGELSSLTDLPAPTVEFSQTLNPWTPGAIEPNAKYVRVSAPSFNMTVWLAKVLPGVGDTQAVGGAAVAGPIPLGAPDDETCDLAPIVMCGTPGDSDCTDGECYGYKVGSDVYEQHVLKTHAQGYSGDWAIGPGNFQLLDFGSGGSTVRECLAGECEACATVGENVTTEPGNKVGPVAQGFNTRFGDYQGGVSATEYPPDTVTYSNPAPTPESWGDPPPPGASDASYFWYDDYLKRQPDGPFDHTPVSQGGAGVPMRRVLAVPIGNCTGTEEGKGEVEVLGIGCFFMTQPVTHSGNTQEIYGQFVNDCKASGYVGEDPDPAAAPFDIVLYKDPINPDS